MQLVQDLIPTSGTFTYIYTLYTYTNTFTNRTPHHIKGKTTRATPHELHHRGQQPGMNNVNEHKIKQNGPPPNTTLDLLDYYCNGLFPMDLMDFDFLDFLILEFRPADIGFIFFLSFFLRFFLFFLLE